MTLCPRKSPRKRFSGAVPRPSTTRTRRAALALCVLGARRLAPGTPRARSSVRGPRVARTPRAARAPGRTPCPRTRAPPPQPAGAHMCSSGDSPATNASAPPRFSARRSRTHPLRRHPPRRPQRPTRRAWSPRTVRRRTAPRRARVRRRAVRHRRVHQRRRLETVVVPRSSAEPALRGTRSRFTRFVRQRLSWVSRKASAVGERRRRHGRQHETCVCSTVMGGIGCTALDAGAPETTARATERRAAPPRRPRRSTPFVKNRRLPPRHASTKRTASGGDCGSHLKCARIHEVRVGRGDVRVEVRVERSLVERLGRLF